MNNKGVSIVFNELGDGDSPGTGLQEEERTILDYDDDENDQYKRHLCFMQSVGSKQIEEEGVFETNDDEGINNDNTYLVDDETGITDNLVAKQYG
uniref:Uncharacterized protein n=1 Tax=Romanomermis culicivorax TaxID=13658 RepID=A0A915JX88_ROMCU